MDEETVAADYLKGFNEGHLMAKHMPDLAAKLAPSLAGSTRGMGFNDGRQEFLLEQKKDKYPAWRKTDWMDKTTEQTFEEKSQDLEKDIDDLELEL